MLDDGRARSRCRAGVIPKPAFLWILDDPKSALTILLLTPFHYLFYHRPDFCPTSPKLLTTMQVVDVVLQQSPWSAIDDL